MASVCPDELSLSPVTPWLSVSGDERKSGPAFSVTHGGCGCVGNDRLSPPPPVPRYFLLRARCFVRLF